MWGESLEGAQGALGQRGEDDRLHGVVCRHRPGGLARALEGACVERGERGLVKVCGEIGGLREAGFVEGYIGVSLDPVLVVPGGFPVADDDEVKHLAIPEGGRGWGLQRERQAAGWRNA